MTFVGADFTLVTPVVWRADWAWSLPLIALTVIVHVMGLGVIKRRAIWVFSRMTERSHSTAVFVVITGAASLLATTLLGIEAGIWAATYRFLGALPDGKTAMLYSLSAMTSYGHANLFLEDHWQLMGALEALNGWLLFGLTAAFLFGIVEKVWPRDL